DRKRSEENRGGTSRTCTFTKKDGGICRAWALPNSDFCVHHSGRPLCGYPVMLAARSHCPQGHAFDEENTAYHHTGARICHTCRSAAGRVIRADKKDEIREYMSSYYHEHRKSFIDRAARRRAQIKRAPTLELVNRQMIYERGGGRCHICGHKVSAAAFHLDHLVPLSDGGEHTARNLAVAHPFCNLSRGPGRLPAQLRLLG